MSCGNRGINYWNHNWGNVVYYCICQIFCAIKIN
jgi:hypothetical protein